MRGVPAAVRIAAARRLAQAVTPVVVTDSGVARKITVLRRVGDKGVMDVRIEDWEEYGAV